MVIPFPAAAAAPVPIGTLLSRCIGFLEGFEDDPEQCVAPLLAQLRVAQQADFIALPAPPTGGVRIDLDHRSVRTGSLDAGGFWFAKHYDDQVYWWSAARIDQSGRRWDSYGLAVVDDFGNLVEVAA